MRGGVRTIVPVVLALTCTALESQAESWARVEASPTCDVREDELTSRVSRALVGPRAADLRADVTIVEQASDYEASIEITRRELVVGTKTVSAPSCVEAIDAIVVVLALALTETAPDGEEARAPSLEVDMLPKVPSSWSGSAPDDAAASGEPTSLRWLAQENDPMAEQRAPTNVEFERRRWSRALLLTGGDTAVLAQPSAFVAAGFSKSLGRIELRGMARYALPRIDETRSAVGSERAEYSYAEYSYAALDFGACYPMGSTWTLSACAGAELGFVRTQRALRDPKIESTSDETEPLAGGVLQAVLAYRGRRVQPLLLLAANANAVGPHASEQRLGLRAAFGAALQF